MKLNSNEINDVLRASGSKGARRATGEPDARAGVYGDALSSSIAPASSSLTTASNPPDPEVSSKATHRRFTAKYKLAIVEQADRCSASGEVGALLRREGLFLSSI